MEGDTGITGAPPHPWVLLTLGDLGDRMAQSPQPQFHPGVHLSCHPGQDEQSFSEHPLSATSTFVLFLPDSCGRQGVITRRGRWDLAGHLLGPPPGLQGAGPFCLGQRPPLHRPWAWPLSLIPLNSPNPSHLVATVSKAPLRTVSPVCSKLASSRTSSALSICPVPSAFAVTLVGWQPQITD